MEQSSFNNHLYTLLTVSLVLRLSSRPTCSLFAFVAGSQSAPLIPLCRFFARYKFVAYLLTYLSKGGTVLGHDGHITKAKSKMAAAPYTIYFQFTFEKYFNIIDPAACKDQILCK